MKLGVVWTTLALAVGLAGCGSVVVRNGPDDGGQPGVDAVALDRTPFEENLLPIDQPRPFDAAGRPCATDAECGPDLACFPTPGGGCAIPRTCQPVQRACSADYMPFCGCDGVTFRGSSGCPRFPWSHSGECETPQVDAGPQSCDLGDGRVCPVGDVCTIRGCVVCQCAAGGVLRCLGGSTGDCDYDASVDGGGTIEPPSFCSDARDCAPGSRCAGPEGCGIAWTCQPSSAGCTPDVAAFCGCDGVSFEGSSSCPGRPYAHRGNCARDGGGPPPICPAQDARGVGNCDAFFGYAWNGAGCVGVSGCSCSGSACTSLAPSEAACERAHLTCPRPI